MDRYIEDRLNQIIVDKGISVAAISSKTGISSDVLYRSFRQNRRLRGDELVKVCAFVGINPMEFFHPGNGEAS